jgi:hypothetical protein
MIGNVDLTEDVERQYASAVVGMSRGFRGVQRRHVDLGRIPSGICSACR